MPTKAIKQFTSWSYSRWKDHCECPRRAKLKHLDKVPDGSKNPAMLRGIVIHKLAEDYVKGDIQRLPPELKLFRKEFAELRKARAIAEGKWAMSVAWEIVEFFDMVRAWCRVVLDAHFKVGKIARVIDYKTGKIYGDNAEQMELYALAGFANYPEVDEVHTELWYLDQGELKRDKFKRAVLPKLQRKWKEKIIPMLTDKKFVPRSGPQCSYCAYSIRKHDPKNGKPLCEF